MLLNAETGISKVATKHPPMIFGSPHRAATGPGLHNLLATWICIWCPSPPCGPNTNQFGRRLPVAVRLNFNSTRTAINVLLPSAGSFLCPYWAYLPEGETSFVVRVSAILSTPSHSELWLRSSEASTGSATGLHTHESMREPPDILRWRLRTGVC